MSESLAHTPTPSRPAYTRPSDRGLAPPDVADGRTYAHLPNAEQASRRHDTAAYGDALDPDVERLAEQIAGHSDHLPGAWAYAVQEAQRRLAAQETTS